MSSACFYIQQAGHLWHSATWSTPKDPKSVDSDLCLPELEGEQTFITYNLFVSLALLTCQFSHWFENNFYLFWKCFMVLHQPCLTCVQHTNQNYYDGWSWWKHLLSQSNVQLYGQLWLGLGDLMTISDFDLTCKLSLKIKYFSAWNHNRIASVGLTIWTGKNIHCSQTLNLNKWTCPIPGVSFFLFFKVRKIKENNSGPDKSMYDFFLNSYYIHWWITQDLCGSDSGHFRAIIVSKTLLDKFSALTTELCVQNGVNIF